MSSAARICLITLFLVLPQYGQAYASGDDASCDHHVAQWLNPADGKVLDSREVFERLSGGRIVLLGEAHTTVAHHRWQHYMLAALHSRNPNMMVGFEMLPRRAQPVLDDWSAGKLDEKEFLERSKWREVWGYDAGLYLPLLHFARLNRLPALALNIDRALVSRVGQQGWSAIDEAERMGLSNPAPASGAYRESLARLYRYKKTMGINGDAAATQQEPDLAEIMRSDAFANFVDAQLTWDRAMAEALAAARRRQPVALVVGIIGRGHIEHRYGIPHQLADLGIPDAAVLLPVDREAVCDGPAADLADAVFVIEPTGRLVATAPKARLGVLVATTDDGVRVANVMEGSVAEATAIEVDDIVVSAAGAPVAKVGELVEIVQRQAPGTWLPLVIRRDGEEIEVVAKFPTSFETPQ